MRLVRSSPFLLAAVLSCTAPRSEDLPPAKTVRTALGWEGGSVRARRVREQHTATLLGTGEVLVAGGRAAAQSTEIIAPFASDTTAGPDLVTARERHTATMLSSGKVLLAGGTGTATAELYDPVARSFAPTGSMSKPRAGHLAVRLRSGRVLVVGGASREDETTELYDPALGTWSAGPARSGKVASALATLADGRVLVIGGTVAADTTEVYDPAAGANGGWSRGGAELIDPSPYGATLTRLTDDRILVGRTTACTGPGSFATCFASTSVYASNAALRLSGPVFVKGRVSFGAVRATSGRVVFVGGSEAREVEVFDPALYDPDATDATLVADGATVATHEVSPTLTVLPGGDILVVGGGQAAVDRRAYAGVWKYDRLSPFRLEHAREEHAAARLHDGRVLVVGGTTVIGSNPVSETDLKAAEILDLRLRTRTAAGDLVGTHRFGTATTLRSGQVLVAGGRTANAELFTPGTGAVAIAPMSVARTRHAATLLPSGKVLVVGGTTDPSAELFDPETATWTTLPKPAHAFALPGAVLMPNGRVLVADGNAAEIYDPTKNEFRSTATPSAAHDGLTAHLLANGSVFFAGGGSLEAELFDPATETWRFTASQATDVPERRWVALPDGRLLVTGGHERLSGVREARSVFDPIAHPLGTFLELPTKMHPVFSHTATLAGNGQVVATGGQGCFGALCPGDSDNAISVYGDDAPAGSRPLIEALPATVVAGSRVQIGGRRFANGAEASDGTRASSAVNHPVALWLSDAGDAVVPSTVLDFTDTTATWVVPTTALHGHGQLFVAVAGIMSEGRSVTIAPASGGVACTNDAQCGSGFCTDGVCCERRCDARCEGCSKARKLSGDDGVCGPVPPGQDIAGRCILDVGATCSAAVQCASGFCADGVCCDSACEGQCLSCNQADKVGRCSGINEGACTAACDGDHTLKQVGIPDVDCTPYKCGGPQCLQTCASVRDCVAPAVCDYDGNCVPPLLPLPPTDGVCGCRAVGSRARGTSALAASAVLAVLFVRRRRR